MSKEIQALFDALYRKLIALEDRINELEKVKVDGGKF